MGLESAESAPLAQPGEDTPSMRLRLHFGVSLLIAEQQSSK